jgi:hypothetical protein
MLSVLPLKPPKVATSYEGSFRSGLPIDLSEFSMSDMVI